MNYSPVANDEVVSRAVVFSGWFAQKNGAYYVKQDAFVPFPKVKLSVIRNVGLKEDEIWGFSKKVAEQRVRTLYGRADVKAESFFTEGLSVDAAPLEGSPNHADVINWPAEKEDQKYLALQIASTAKFFAVPKS